MKASQMWMMVLAMCATMVLTAGLPMSAGAADSAGLKGNYEKLDEPSTHRAGKVQMIVFADFYCPHCHHFEESGLPVLKKEFGEQLDATMVGFPVFRQMLPTPFEMYEQAKVMGKGEEMKKVLFRTIHHDKVKFIDKSLRAGLIKEVGLDPVAFEAGLDSGKPIKALEEGKKLGEKAKLNQTPTLVLDGNIKITDINPENVKVVIRSILDQDGKKK
ncbi:MAG: DsbA family protein [Nitrospiraceae bacterium]